MAITVVPFEDAYVEDVVDIWNEVIEAGNAFPQIETLPLEEASAFFKAQSFTGVALDDTTNEVVGVYILHPNNIGRCGHLCNTSYAVKAGKRGLHIGESLVTHSMKMGKEKGFRILQFNAVVASNEAALRLYKRLGFTQLGTVPGGFLNGEGVYEDIILHYIEL